jgi:hypothetical protein
MAEPAEQTEIDEAAALTIATGRAIEACEGRPHRGRQKTGVTPGAGISPARSRCASPSRSRALIESIPVHRRPGPSLGFANLRILLATAPDETSIRATPILEMLRHTGFIDPSYDPAYALLFHPRHQDLQRARPRQCMIGISIHGLQMATMKSGKRVTTGFEPRRRRQGSRRRLDMIDG